MMTRAFFILIGTLATVGFAGDSVDCNETLSRVVYEYQKGLLGTEADPRARVETLIDSKKLEDAVIHVFTINPDYRKTALQHLKEDFGLSDNELFDIMNYYSDLLVGYDPRVFGELAEKAYARAQEVARDHYVGYPAQEDLNHLADRAAINHPYYVRHITQKSVPEMADQLGLTEGQVYQHLSRIGVSIVREFGEKLSEAQRRYKAGEPVAQIAKDLNVGERALEFILHFSGERNRGVGWNRFGIFEGRMEIEPVILAALVDRGFTASQIAAELNRIFKTKQEDPDYRTEASVQQKKAALGMTEPRESSAAEGDEMLTYPKHVRGRFVPRPTAADQKEELDRMVSRYEQQRRVIQLHIAWQKRNPGKVAGEADYRDQEGKINVPYDQLWGHGHFEGRGLFSSKEEFLFALQDAYRAEGLAFSFLDRKIYGSTPRIRHARQREAIERQLKWQRENPGKIAKTRDYGKKPGQIRVYYQALYGKGKYGNGAENAIFSTTEDALFAMKEAYAKEGLEFWLLDKELHHYSDRMREALQIEAIQRHIDWQKKHPGKLMAQSDYGKRPGKIGVNYQSFFGNGHYRKGGPAYGFHIFESRDDALFALKRAYENEGLRFSFLERVIEGGVTDRMRAEWKKEAVQLHLEWQKKAGRLPRSSDYGFGEGQIRVNYNRMYGGGEYRHGGKNEGTRIFSSREEALKALKEAGVLVPEK